MSNKFSVLSDNSFLLLESVFDNKDLMKLVYYNKENPLDEPDTIAKQDVFMKSLKPVPFANDVPKEQSCELRIFFEEGEVLGNTIANTYVAFQFIYHNDLALIKIKNKDEDYKPKIRAYEVLDKVVKTFEKKSIGTIGVLTFAKQRFKYFHVSDNYSMYELSAKMMTV